MTSSYWTKHLLGMLAACAVLIVGCGGPPNNNPLLDDARVTLASASNDSAVVASAAETLDRAEISLRKGETLLEEGADPEEVDHYAYLTKQYVAIAEQRAALETHEKEIEQGESERQQVMLEAREREAAAKQREAELARSEAELARSQADVALERARELDEKVRELEAKQTERGLVLTLSDVLFDVGKATLKEGGQRTVGQLATFLQQYPERRVLVEGHTDSTGSLELNRNLSQSRAEAIKAALMEMGIAAERIGTMGFGPAHPVASNDTAAGRQQNRRVEIIISDEEGVITERTNP